MERHCPYVGCNLKCRTEEAHRAKYAYMAYGWKQKIEELDETMKIKKSKLIDYKKLRKSGILFPLNKKDRDNVDTTSNTLENITISTASNTINGTITPRDNNLSEN
jgi:lipid II:glycine glycyltransferase (peptidoglycan interpeptide bridge formation enzyme)